MKIEIFLTERNDVEKTKKMLYDALGLVVDSDITFVVSAMTKNDHLHIVGEHKQQEANLQVALEALLKIAELQK